MDRICALKILFDHDSAFLLAHGGFQIQIEQTKAALEAIQVDVEYLRWWDDAQRADIVHYFGRPAAGYIRSAQLKGMKVMIAPLLTGMGSRSRRQLFFQKILTKSIRRLLPEIITAPFGWNSFQTADACMALTAWEAYLMSYMFGASPQKVHVIPNGVEDVFLQSHPAQRGQWLVCTATITERKRILELAQAAARAQTPLWIIGKAYADADPYAQQFFALAKQNPNIIRYEGPARSREWLAQTYRQARGFVLLSNRESLSLSAGEAAACECPMLLSDLPWARTVFKNSVAYCPITSTPHTAKMLRQFYDAAPGLKPPSKPLTWIEAARELKSVYERLLNTSR
jgi:glycosyltransferase involved in cell wall biosynthesis